MDVPFQAQAKKSQLVWLRDWREIKYRSHQIFDQRSLAGGKGCLPRNCILFQECQRVSAQQNFTNTHRNECESTERCIGTCEQLRRSCLGSVEQPSLEIRFLFASKRRFQKWQRGHSCLAQVLLSAWGAAMVVRSFRRIKIISETPSTNFRSSYFCVSLSLSSLLSTHRQIPLSLGRDEASTRFAQSWLKSLKSATAKWCIALNSICIKQIQVF